MGWARSSGKDGSALVRPVEAGSSRVLRLSMTLLPSPGLNPSARWQRDWIAGVLAVGVLSAEGDLDAPEPLAGLDPVALSEVIRQLDAVMG